MVELNVENYETSYTVSKIKAMGFEKPRVLIVDDNSFNIMAISHYLKKYPIEVKKSFNGQECLDLLFEERAEGRSFKLIFMDI